MRLRAAQLACLLLLLSTFGVAVAAALPAGYPHAATVRIADLQRDATDTAGRSPAAVRRRVGPTACQGGLLDLPAAPALRTPSLRAADLHAVTGSGL